MRVKVAELTTDMLDWNVSNLECGFVVSVEGLTDDQRYSTEWSQGGPIIDRECICTYASGACSIPPKNPDYWVAEILDTDGMITQYGETPLIAAMRCFVASRLGDEVVIPDNFK